MLNEATRQFVNLHRDDDVRRLALQTHAMPDVDLPEALDQIRGRQTARVKLPSWAAIDDIVYPPHLSMEQCSSEQTAQYKAQLLARLLSSASGNTSPERTFIDLTGGFGVDFVAMAQVFHESPTPENAPNHGNNRLVYVERNTRLCDLARHNFPLLGLPDAEIVCDTAENVLENPSSLLAPHSSKIIFLDPARRDAHGNRTYSLADCTPNVLEMRDELLKKADFIVLKLSPMLDWNRAVGDLGNVSEVHIVSVGNECREMLLVLKNGAENVKIFCVNDNQTFSCDAEAVKKPVSSLLTCENASETGFFNPKNASGRRLFVPNASVMKAGCFGELCERFQLKGLAPNSHLFVNAADEMPDGFPGRVFQIFAVSSMNKHDLRENLKGIARANISTRNFPMKPEDLRKRLKIREGGDTYIFATTLADKRHVLILCEHAPS